MAKQSHKMRWLFKRKLFRKANFIKCRFCRRQLAYNEATIDHLIPQCKGGQDTKSNWGISCSLCNTMKADMDLEYFQAHYAEIKARFEGRPRRRLRIVRRGRDVFKKRIKRDR